MVVTTVKLNFTNFSLAELLRRLSKEELQKFADKIDIYLPHSHRKDQQAEELASAIIEEPINTLRQFSNRDLDIIRAIVAAGGVSGSR